MKENKDNILVIPLEKILPNRFQPRIKFSEESILNLADSIKEHGVLQPIIVRSIGDKYEIVAGERRYKATVLSGLKEIPALLFDMNDKDSAEIALIENVQRKDLSPIEEAISYKKILDMGYLTQSDLATKIGVSQSAVANKIRLLNLCDDVQEALLDEKISERHARSLLKVESDEVQAQMLKRVLSKKLTVRALDDEIDYYQKNNKFKETEEKEIISEVSREPIIEIKNTSEEKELSPKDSIEKIKKELEEEKSLNNNTEEKIKEEEKIDNEEKVNDENSIFEDVSDLEENSDEEGEKDMNNNLQNLNEDINYNTLKTSNANPGKFFMNVEEEKEVKEEKKDSNSIFNFDNSNNSGNIFTDLMAPQGSKNLFRPGTTQESVIPGATEEQKEETNTQSTNVSSMFENLMGVPTSSSQEIDKDTFAQFMDPSFVDGQKQEATENNNINSNVFSKFIDASEDTKSLNENVVKTEEPKKEQGFGSSIFGNLFNKEKKEENNNSVTDLNTSNNETKPGFAPSIFSGFSKPVPTPQPIEEIKPVEEVKTIEEKPEEVVEEIVENDEPIEIKEEEKIESTDTPSSNDNGGDIFINNTSSMPDLLAPMGEINPNEPIQLDNISNDIFASSNNNTSESNTKLEENNEEMVEEKEVVDTKEDETKEEENTKVEEEKEDEEQISFNASNPIFVKASSSEEETTMPTSPIIDVPEEVEEEETVEVPEPAPVVTNIEIMDPEEEVESDINNMIGNQPIIVTDYNKQYDPVIPTAGEPAEKIDFKKILSLIRELSETIEKCGYEIDTDEIDLQDKYQVIFNINKQ